MLNFKANVGHHSSLAESSSIKLSHVASKKSKLATAPYSSDVTRVPKYLGALWTFMIHVIKSSRLNKGPAGCENSAKTSINVL